jgi:glycosyltransferase involved in cell wall biosynthesis
VAPLEALAHGLPVVVSDLACFDDYLRNDSFAFRFNQNANTAAARLAGVLEKILVNPQSWPEIAIAARARAAELSMERVAQMYLEKFQALLPLKPALRHS